MAFIKVDTYQKRQGSNEVCTANAWDELNNLKLTSVYPGGVETFLAKWEDALDKLQDVNQAPTEFLERTLLKKVQKKFDVTYDSHNDNFSNAELSTSFLCRWDVAHTKFHEAAM